MRKLKEQHLSKERKQHFQDTQKAYQVALSLYHQQKLSLARDAFRKVEDLMADFRSTDTFLKGIENRSVEELKQKMSRVMGIKVIQLEVKLAEEDLRLYQQSAWLDEDKNSDVKKKLSGLIEKYRQAPDQEYIQRQLDQIALEAGNFDQKIFQLNQSGDYPAAKKEYEEFQQAMINELIKVTPTD